MNTVLEILISIKILEFKNKKFFENTKYFIWGIGIGIYIKQLIGLDNVTACGRTSYQFIRMAAL
jgi:hypothetical protein